MPSTLRLTCKTGRDDSVYKTSVVFVTAIKYQGPLHRREVVWRSQEHKLLPSYLRLRTNDLRSSNWYQHYWTRSYNEQHHNEWSDLNAGTGKITWLCRKVGLLLQLWRLVKRNRETPVGGLKPASRGSAGGLHSGAGGPLSCPGAAQLRTTPHRTTQHSLRVYKT